MISKNLFATDGRYTLGAAHSIWLVTVSVCNLEAKSNSKHDAVFYWFLGE